MRDQGVWIYELAEMAGYGRVDVNRFKNFVSQTVDRARPAFGRGLIGRAGVYLWGRRTIMIICGARRVIEGIGPCGCGMGGALIWIGWGQAAAIEASR